MDDLRADGEHRNDPGGHEAGAHHVRAERTRLLHCSSELGRGVVIRVTPTDCNARAVPIPAPLPPTPLGRLGEVLEVVEVLEVGPMAQRVRTTLIVAWPEPLRPWLSVTVTV